MDHTLLHFYLIPGMGANAELYANYQLPGHVHALSWPEHGQSKNLADYARILANEITTSNNVIVGSSMGGMVATELSHLIQPVATILLSAPYGRHQFPLSLKLLRRLYLHRLLSANVVYRMAKAADLFMGFQKKADRDRFYSMLNTLSPSFLHFSVGAVLEWKHTQPPTGPYVHILGQRDKLFRPVGFSNKLEVRDAGHFATFEKSDLICRLIQLYLDCDKNSDQTLQKARQLWPEEIM